MIVNAGHKKERALKIKDQIKDADLIILQEAFPKRIRKILSTDFAYSVQPKKKFLKLNSGLLILSKTPISSIKFYNFRNKKGIDRLCNKGAVRFTVDGIKYTATHLQNHYPQITEKQISELFVFANGSDVVVGDFNYEDPEYLKLIFDKNYEPTSATFENQIIDYVLTNKKIRSTVKQTDLSDHRPLYFFFTTM
jgi:endonuclease/exonuclease/phosphatase family metal-dependent hydrolase